MLHPTRKRRFLAPLVPDAKRMDDRWYGYYYFIHEWIGLRYDRIRNFFGIRL